MPETERVSLGNTGWLNKVFLKQTCSFSATIKCRIMDTWHFLTLRGISEEILLIQRAKTQKATFLLVSNFAAPIDYISP